MKPHAFVVTPNSYPRSLDVVGEKVTVLASGADTQGYEIFLQQGPEGSGPPPHSHPWDESFYVVKGEVEFGLGDEITIVAAGSLVHIPAGTVHRFRVREGGCEMISMTAKLGASRMFADIDREIAPESPALDKLVGVVARHGVTVAA